MSGAVKTSETFRPSEHQILMGTAESWADRSTCSRLHVGAVLSINGRIIATGYNGAPAGAPHCVHVEDRPCTDAVHCETNLFGFCAKYGIRTEGAILTVTHQPCLPCAMLTYAAGVIGVVYKHPYRDTAGLRFLTSVGIFTVGP